MRVTRNRNWLWRLLEIFDTDPVSLSLVPSVQPVIDITRDLPRPGRTLVSETHATIAGTVAFSLQPAAGETMLVDFWEIQGPIATDYMVLYFQRDLQGTSLVLGIWPGNALLGNFIPLIGCTTQLGGVQLDGLPPILLTEGESLSLSLTSIAGGSSCQTIAAVRNQKDYEAHE